MSRGPAWEQVTRVRCRLEVRLTPADAGQRVVIRWRRPSPGDGEQIADVLGILEENDPASFAVRTADGALVVIPAARALAGKVVPPAPRNRRRAWPRSSLAPRRSRTQRTGCRPARQVLAYVGVLVALAVNPTK
jgi:hypothetical protein